MNSEDTENIESAAAPEAAAETEAAGVAEAEKNLVEIEEAEEQEQAANPDNGLDEQIRNNTLRNVTLADAEMKMFGDRTVLAQIAQLVAYIRHAVKNNQPTEIRLSICKSDSTVVGAEFMFDLNGCQVPDLMPQQEVFIN